LINLHLPQRVSLEPFTPEELIRNWEHLRNTRLSKKLRKFALLVAAIHLDEARGITVQDIKLLLNCPTIDAAEKRKDEAVKRGLLVPHSTSKMASKNYIFYQIMFML
jgi:hypothetical protein